MSRHPSRCEPTSTIDGFNSIYGAPCESMVFPLLPPLPLVVGSMRHDLQSTAPSADAAATPDFDPSLYPRTYRLATGWGIFALAASSAVILGGLVRPGFLATR